jgi:hypothetical protein
MPYLINEIDQEDRADVLIMQNHTKIVLLSIGDYRIILSGSSNLRSSGCYEQFILQDNDELYDFYKAWFEEARQYSIINKEAAK